MNGTYRHTVARVSVKRLAKGDLRLSFRWGTIDFRVLVPVLLVFTGTTLGRTEADLV